MFSKVNEKTAFKIKVVEPNRALLWAKPDSTWAWKLTPLPGERTRLVTRDWSAPSAAVSAILLEFGDFPMIRRMLNGIRNEPKE